jgi:hypothetical protein
MRDTPARIYNHIEGRMESVFSQRSRGSGASNSRRTGKKAYLKGSSSVQIISENNKNLNVDDESFNEEDSY